MFSDESLWRKPGNFPPKGWVCCHRSASFCRRSVNSSFLLWTHDLHPVTRQPLQRLQQQSCAVRACVRARSHREACQPPTAPNLLNGSRTCGNCVSCVRKVEEHSRDIPLRKAKISAVRAKRGWVSVVRGARFVGSLRNRFWRNFAPRAGCDQGLFSECISCRPSPSPPRLSSAAAGLIHTEDTWKQARSGF